jgi:hypothetical protein
MDLHEISTDLFLFSFFSVDTDTADLQTTGLGQILRAT